MPNAATIIGAPFPIKFQIVFRASNRPLVRSETDFAALMSICVPQPLSQTCLARAVRR
jgi:hypothetical protein